MTVAWPVDRGGPQRYRFSVAEYHRLAEAGILGEDDYVELIAGEIFKMNPPGLRHIGCVDALGTSLIGGLWPRAIVRVRGPIRLDDQSEPQPDLALLRPRSDFYRTSPSTPECVLSVIEVMDSSAGYDRGFKLGVYARARIAEVWLIDLGEEQVEAYRRPSSDRYSVLETYRRGQSVSPEAFPDFSLGVDAILG